MVYSSGQIHLLDIVQSFLDHALAYASILPDGQIFGACFGFNMLPSGQNFVLRNFFVGLDFSSFPDDIVKTL